MAQYQSNMVQIAAPGGIAFVRALGANPQRLTITIGSITSATIAVADRDTIPGGGFFARSGGVINVPLTYCNFGPLIRGEIWVASLTGAATLFVTEIYRI